MLEHILLCVVLIKIRFSEHERFLETGHIPLIFQFNFYLVYIIKDTSGCISWFVLPRQVNYKTSRLIVVFAVWVREHVKLPCFFCSSLKKCVFNLVGLLSCMFYHLPKKPFTVVDEILRWLLLSINYRWHVVNLIVKCNFSADAGRETLNSVQGILCTKDHCNQNWKIQEFLMM